METNSNISFSERIKIGCKGMPIIKLNYLEKIKEEKRIAICNQKYELVYQIRNDEKSVINQLIKMNICPSIVKEIAELSNFKTNKIK